MSNVVKFTPKKTALIVISTGRFITNTETDPVEVGNLCYFVEVIEADGGIIGMWDGESRAEALKAARELSADWGNAPIVDRVPA